MRAVGVCVGMWKIKTSGGFGQRWPTPTLLEGKRNQENIKKRISVRVL